LSKLYPLLSILMALALALFEFFFFFQTSGVEETTGPFGPDRLGFTLAWIALVYLYLPASHHSPCRWRAGPFHWCRRRHGIGRSFGVSLVVIFGKPDLLVSVRRLLDSFESL
jgi:hypothetical protein